MKYSNENIGLIIIMCLVSFLSCKKDPVAPNPPAKKLATISNDSITKITRNSAIIFSTISSDGGSAIISRGVCWGINPIPTIDDNKTSDGNGIGSFSSPITALAANTTYYVRPYAINSIGISYGAQISFSTLPLPLAVITTDSVSNIMYNSAICYSNIPNDGGGLITARGVCWDTIANPTINQNKSTNGTGTGAFISSLTGLTPNATTYYVRAYATNSAGTAYGSQIVFKTLYNLDGVWWFGSSVGYEMTIAGSSAKFTQVYDGGWLRCLNNGLITLNVSEKFKNITALGPNKWKAEQLWHRYWISDGNPYEVFWGSTDTLTISAEGRALSVNGSPAYYLKSKRRFGEKSTLHNAIDVRKNKDAKATVPKANQIKIKNKPTTTGYAF